MYLADDQGDVSSRWQVEFAVITFEGCALVWRIVLHVVGADRVSAMMARQMLQDSVLRRVYYDLFQKSIRASSCILETDAIVRCDTKSVL